jgi:hypothetical protein
LAFRFILARLGLSLVLAFGLALLGLAFDFVWCGMDCLVLTWLLAWLVFCLVFWLLMAVLGF